MSNKAICAGCGQAMQTHDPSASNYVLDLDFKLCMRCFRWQHYKDLPSLIKPIRSLKSGINIEVDAHDEIMVVVDAMFLKETFVRLIPHLKALKNLSIVASKLDLFPKQIQAHHIEKEINYFVQKHALDVKAIWVTSNHIKSTITTLRSAMLATNNKRFVFVGMVNSGKSTLINALLEQDQITISEYPQTTLSPIVSHYHDLEIVDTPGFSDSQHLFYRIDPKLYQKLIPRGVIRPRIYQCVGDVALLIEDLFIIYVSSSDKISVSLYLSNDLAIKKIKQRENLNTRLSDPNYKITKLAYHGNTLDFLVEGIGKVHVVGKVTALSIAHHAHLTISKYKGTLLW